MSFKFDRSSIDFSKLEILNKLLEVLDRRGVMLLLACLTVIICVIMCKDKYKFHSKLPMILDTTTGEWSPTCDNNRLGNTPNCP